MTEGSFVFPIVICSLSQFGKGLAAFPFLLIDLAINDMW